MKFNEETIIEKAMEEIPKEDKHYLENHLAYEQGNLMSKVIKAIKKVIQIVRVERFEEIERRLEKLEKIKERVGEWVIFY